MKRLYGRAARGWRVTDHASGGHWRTHTVTAAIDARGIVAAMVTKKAINSITFLGFIEKYLAPKLKPGDVVVMDNLAVHKVKGVDEALRAVGARAWFLPPYSPDFNPIEQAWSQAKSWLRKKSPPTFNRLVRSIGDALRRVTAEHSRNYFRNAGYTVTP